MQSSLIWFISIASLVVAVTSSASVGYLQELVPQNVLESLLELRKPSTSPELVRSKKSAYGGNSLPAPPCPKSYLFSCQSSVAPVPCAPAPAAPSYAGAYSEPVPSYSLPQRVHQGIPQELFVPAYDYNQYLY